MEWNPTETVTIGGVFVGIVVLLLGIVRIIGQRSDPQLLAFLTSYADGNKDAFDRLADNIEKSNDILSALKEGMESLSRSIAAQFALLENNTLKQNNEVIQVFKAFRDSVQKEHTFALGAIQAIPEVIKPAIAELTAQQAATEKSNKGMQTIMEGVAKTQSATNGEILQALQRIQETLDGLKTEMAERVEKIEADVDVIKADLMKPPTTPAPDNQPVVKAEPDATTAKPETESEEKDKPNV